MINLNKDPMTIRVDIDETICISPADRNYNQAEPIIENIKKINSLYDNGHIIIYWTGRGCRSGIDWHDITVEQLSVWGAKYHKLECNKPFYDLFIDDKSIPIESLR